MFIYAFVLAGIQKEFPRHTKTELQTRVTHDLVL